MDPILGILVPSLLRIGGGGGGDGWVCCCWGCWFVRLIGTINGCDGWFAPGCWATCCDTCWAVVDCVGAAVTVEGFCGWVVTVEGLTPSAVASFPPGRKSLSNLEDFPVTMKSDSLFLLPINRESYDLLLGSVNPLTASEIFLGSPLFAAETTDGGTWP